MSSARKRTEPSEAGRARADVTAGRAPLSNESRALMAEIEPMPTTCALDLPVSSLPPSVADALRQALRAYVALEG